MRPIPTWFERDLALIDPEYFVVYNDHYDYFEIKRKMSFSRKVEIPGSATADGRVLRKDQLLKVAMRNPTVAVFKILNDAALLNLREDSPCWTVLLSRRTVPVYPSRLKLHPRSRV